MEVQRHKAAITRTSLSTPLQFLISQGLLKPGDRILDFGCGKGDDVRYLTAFGYDARGWDPHFFPTTHLGTTDLVNLGFVLNVIEDPQERAQSLREAWGCTGHVLAVAVRTTADLPSNPGTKWKDGYLTRLGTFQKYFTPAELSEFVELTLGQKPVHGAPGLALIFREDTRRQQFVARRFRRAPRIPAAELAKDLFESERELFDQLLAFYTDRGRPPEPQEWVGFESMEERVGSLRKAMAVLRRVLGADMLEDIRSQASEDLALFFALETFAGRPRFSELEESLRRDVKAFYGSYKAACAAADHLLFSLGNGLLIDAACRDSRVGKLTGSSLYVHRSSLDSLDSVLRAYEGCARAVLGDLPEANLIKFHRRKPAISYLSYPDFDLLGHPELKWSYFVDLRGLSATFEDFSSRENPPILHRKEQLVAEDYPLFQKFARLTKREEEVGLFENPEQIGTRYGWESTLRSCGVKIRGHRVFSM